METSNIIEQMRDFDETVEKLRGSFKSEDAEGVKRNLGEIFPYVVHYLRERNYEKLRHLGEKLAHLTFDFDDGTKDLQIARQLGYLQALENVVRKMMNSEVERETFEALKKEPRYAELLSIIKREGIIEHNELADKLGVSSEGLHEIIKTIYRSEAITFITYGEMRYYNLTSAGEAMYDLVRKQAFLPELAHRLKRIYQLVMDEGRSAPEVLRLVRPEEDDWCSEDEILPIIEAFVDIREEKKAHTLATLAQDHEREELFDYGFELSKVLENLVKHRSHQIEIKRESISLAAQSAKDEGGTKPVIYYLDVQSWGMHYLNNWGSFMSEERLLELVGRTPRLITSKEKS